LKFLPGKQKAGYEFVVFHTNGGGGMDMERMIQHGIFSVVIDLTAHELANELAGGDHACSPRRLEGASAMKIPQIVASGSLNYIAKGRFEALTPPFKKRKTMTYNLEMTFAQTSAKETTELGRIVARCLNRSHGNTVMMIPTQGFSHPNFEG
jgi:uncharacterized protein (UPF0261 family)